MEEDLRRFRPPSTAEGSTAVIELAIWLISLRRCSYLKLKAGETTGVGIGVRGAGVE